MLENDFDRSWTCQTKTDAFYAKKREIDTMCLHRQMIHVVCLNENSAKLQQVSSPQVDSPLVDRASKSEIQIYDAMLARRLMRLKAWKLHESV